jgi:hypothetical protein
MNITEETILRESNEAGCEIFGHMPTPSAEGDNETGMIFEVVCARCGKHL